MDPTSPDKNNEEFGNYMLRVLQMVNERFSDITYNQNLEQGTKASILASYSRAIEAVMLGGRFPVSGNPTVPPNVPVFNLEGSPIPGFPTRVG